MKSILRLATLGSAEITGRADKFGTVEGGKYADLILVKGDLLQNMSDIRKITFTFKDGVVYSAEALYEAIGIKHPRSGRLALP